ncbi:ferredoxin reductase-like C-terminal NADP-linked domain-containing protein [Dacryopinax primogenitus]|uniref:NADH-cytochrome b5 reductase n=1 Tax=Dacryopinax primogenitus (strain DJM 731) TaxID=1858805 RepID=M5FX13_DACPD|nr:ferredoxin reductase-like C-terminal NADP-linked domain-containing protein [Dacryopinax primogenitus]EJU02531.1 ferredoxin reductase-like C-terminal NADP-linked domain-containing protein [Dacryopinax primogenitus]
MFPLRPPLLRSLLTRRSLSTAPDPLPKDANWPLYLSIFGVSGLALWVYWQKTGQLQWDPVKNAQERRRGPTAALDRDEFRTFELKRKEPYNYNTSRYVFALPEKTATLLPVAACVLLKAADDETGPKDDKGRPVVRPYTPISDSRKVGEVDFLIKKYETGKFTPYLSSLEPGDKISIKGPLPKFAYEPNKFSQCGLIAGGSGITPMYQLLKHSLSIPEDKTHWTLIFANVSAKDILLKEEFDALAQAHPDRLNVVYVLDKPEKGFTGPTGYVTKELIKQHLPGPELGEKTKLFVCGPPGQVAAVAGKKAGMKQGELGGALKDLGYTEDQVFKF